MQNHGLKEDCSKHSMETLFHKLKAAVEPVSPSKNLWKPGMSYSVGAQIPNEMAAVDSLSKEKSESSALFSDSFLRTVWHEPDPLFNILHWMVFCSLEFLPVIVSTVCYSSGGNLMESAVNLQPCDNTAMHY